MRATPFTTAQACCILAGVSNTTTGLVSQAPSIPECELPTLPFPQPPQEPAHQGKTPSPEAHERHDISSAEVAAPSSKYVHKPSSAGQRKHGALKDCTAGMTAGEPDPSCPGSQRHALADLPGPLLNAQLKSQAVDAGEDAYGSGRGSADHAGKRPCVAFKRWRQEKVKRGSLQDVWSRNGQAHQT